MSRFFVGQRVRIVACDYPPYEGLIGSEAIVDELDAVNKLDVGGHIGITIPGDPRSFCFWPWELEPILPDGHRACDEDFKRDLDKLLSKEESRVS